MSITVIGGRKYVYVSSFWNGKGVFLTSQEINDIIKKSDERMEKHKREMAQNFGYKYW